MIKKSKRAIFWKLIITFFSVIPLIFQMDYFNQNKIDVYLLVDKVRYAENIAYDIFGIMSIIIMYHTIYQLIPEKKYKRYSYAFLVIAWLGLPLYFLVYSQFISILLIPILISLLIIAHLKNKNEERNNII